MMDWIPFLPEHASTFAEKVDALYLFLVAISVFFTGLIATLVIVFAVKFRRRSEDERPAAIHGSLLLETVWSVIPLAICVVIFVWSAHIYIELTRIPANAVDVYVVGKRWMWKLQHLTGQREINELHVPVGVPIKLNLTSEDVIHSFYVPAFRIKKDAVPGRYTTAWFQATKPGRYHLFCAEYCGTKHSGMIGSVVVMEPADFEVWLAGGTSGGSLAQQGQRLAQALGCATCHRPDAQGRGPRFEGLFGKKIMLSSGEYVTADEEYLRESILTPSAKLHAGYQPVMPTFQGVVNEEGVVQLVAYIKSLQNPEGTEAPVDTAAAAPAGASDAKAPVAKAPRGSKP